LVALYPGNAEEASRIRPCRAYAVNTMRLIHSWYPLWIGQNVQLPSVRIAATSRAVHQQRILWPSPSPPAKQWRTHLLSGSARCHPITSSIELHPRGEESLQRIWARQMCASLYDGGKVFRRLLFFGEISSTACPGRVRLVRLRASPAEIRWIKSWTRCGEPLRFRCWCCTTPIRMEALAHPLMRPCELDGVGRATASGCGFHTCRQRCSVGIASLSGPAWWPPPASSAETCRPPDVRQPEVCGHIPSPVGRSQDLPEFWCGYGYWRRSVQRIRCAAALRSLRSLRSRFS